MSKRVKIEYNTAGFKQVLLNGKTHALVVAETGKVEAAAGDGFKGHVAMGGFGGGRWIGYVWADTYKARREQAENLTLEKALNAL